VSDGHGGFENVRENVDGHPMVSLLRYATRYWPRLLVGILAAVLTRVSRLIPPIVVATAIDRIVLETGSPGLLADVGLLPGTAVVGESARLVLLERLVVIAVLAYLVRSVTRFASRYLLQSSAQKIQRDLRNDSYDHLQRLSMGFFADHQTGGMMSILNSDVNRLEQFLNTEFRQAIRVVATVGGISLVLWYYSPTLALVALAPVPLVGVASALFLRAIEPRYKSIRETVSRLNARLENNLGGVAVVKAFDRYDFELGRVEAQSCISVGGRSSPRHPGRRLSRRVRSRRSSSTSVGSTRRCGGSAGRPTSTNRQSPAPSACSACSAANGH
jgi:ATP-binding cassette subfamily B protein